LEGFLQSRKLFAKELRTGAEAEAREEKLVDESFVSILLKSHDGFYKTLRVLTVVFKFA
jgi:hypothetical protein